jgi:hypothetical protein
MYVFLRSGPQPGTIDRALVVCSIWLQVGYLGAATVAVGLLKAFMEDGNLVPGLVQALSGAVLAACCWRRAWGVMQRGQGAPRAATSSSSRAAATATAPASTSR